MTTSPPPSIPLAHIPTRAPHHPTTTYLKDLLHPVIKYQRRSKKWNMWQEFAGEDETKISSTKKKTLLAANLKGPSPFVKNKTINTTQSPPLHNPLNRNMPIAAGRCVFPPCGKLE
jgi:hypothetical protein